MATDGFLFSSDHFSIILPYLGWECCCFKHIWLVNKDALQAFRRYFDQLVEAEGLYGQPGWRPTNFYNFEGMPETTARNVLWEDARPWLERGLDNAINMALVKNAGYGGVSRGNRLFSINYSLIYHICLQPTPYNHSEVAYIWVTDYMKKWALRLKGSNVYNSLSEVDKEKRWKIISKYLKKVFLYLDKYHVIDHNLPRIEELAASVKVEILD